MCAIDDVSKSEEGPQEGHYEAPSHRIFFHATPAQPYNHTRTMHKLDLISTLT